MAQRLCTHYANALFTMNEVELRQFVKLFSNENIIVQVKMCENGDCEVSIADRSGEIRLPFQRLGNTYSCESSYVISDPALANIMRKAMKQFRGHGVVERVYEGFTVVYHYDEGSVTRIEELNGNEETVVYENRTHQQTRQLESLFQQNRGEQEIQLIREETDRLLDLRNRTEKTATIDLKLAELARRLYTLEA